MPLLVAHHCMQISTSVLYLTFSSMPFWIWEHQIKHTKYWHLLLWPVSVDAFTWNTLYPHVMILTQNTLGGARAILCWSVTELQSQSTPVKDRSFSLLHNTTRPAYVLKNSYVFLILKFISSMMDSITRTNT